MANRGVAFPQNLFISHQKMEAFAKNCSSIQSPLLIVQKTLLGRIRWNKKRQNGHRKRQKMVWHYVKNYTLFFLFFLSLSFGKKHNQNFKTLTITDFDQQLLQKWGEWEIEFVGVSLEQLLENFLNKNLTFEPEMEIAIENAQMIFIGVDIPLKVTGRWNGFDLCRFLSI